MKTLCVAALELVRGTFSPQFKLELSPRRHRHMIDAPTLGMPILELRRRETAIEPVYGYVPAQSFYLIDHNLGDGSGWTNFWDPLPKVTSPIELSFLFKQTNLTPRRALRVLCQHFRTVSDKRNPDRAKYTRR